MGPAPFQTLTRSSSVNLEKSSGAIALVVDIGAQLPYDAATLAIVLHKLVALYYRVVYLNN